MMVLNHGKPVLCEKPLGMNYEEAKEMIDFAREKKLFLMEVCKYHFFSLFKSQDCYSVFTLPESESET